MKRIISLALVLMLVLSLSVTAFAAETGSITINTVSTGTTYTIYRMMDLESYDKAAGAYSYLVNEDWEAFFTTGEGKDYVTIDPVSEYVTWTAADDDTTKAEFAQKALAYAQAKTPSIAIKSHTVTTETSYTFTGLELGWYLVDTNAGALCGLTTTDPDASVNAKNGKPTVDKQVQEDLGGLWGDSNTADIGQIVNFMTDIHVAAGAQNYVLHDEMSAGLTFEHNTTAGRGVTEIKLIRAGATDTTLVENTDYTVNVTGLTDGCDFEVVFTDTFVATLKANDRIHVFYNAMVNRNAVIAGTGNPNETHLSYGEANHTSNTDTTTTYTFSINIVKTDSSNKLINGAKFRIYDALTGGNEVRVVELRDATTNALILDSKGQVQYRRARADETTGVDIVVNGEVTVIGFDNGTYYLEEVKAPDGYNQLTARQEFTINDGNLESIYNDGVYSTGSGVHVVNKTGNMLPETGAMGTTLFIAFGMFTVLAAGVLLVTKKRMAMIEE